MHKVQIYVTHRLPTRQQTQQMPLVKYEDFTHNNKCSKYSSLVDKFYGQRGGSANCDLFQQGWTSQMGYGTWTYLNGQNDSEMSIEHHHHQLLCPFSENRNHSSDCKTNSTNLHGSQVTMILTETMINCSLCIKIMD